jgi:hypothetical protein
MQTFLAWLKDLEAKGHMKNYGHALERTGGGVVRDAKGTVIDGPYADTKEIVIGFSVVEAKAFRQGGQVRLGVPAGVGRRVDRGAADLENVTAEWRGFRWGRAGRHPGVPKTPHTGRA